MKRSILLSLFLILLLIIFYSCGKRSKIIETSFGEYLETGIDSFSIKASLLKPSIIAVNDSMLLIQDNSTDTLCRLYNLKSGEYLGWFGKKGRGPKEYLFINPSSIEFYSDGLQISDIKNIYLIKFNNRKVSDDYETLQKIKIPDNLYSLNHIKRLGENKYCGVAYGKKSEKSIDFFNTQYIDTGSFLDFPNYIDGVVFKELKAVYNFAIDYNPGNKTFALMYYFFPYLRIFKSDGTILSETHINNLPEQITFHSLGEKEGNLLYGFSYYYDIKVTDRFIYAFYRPQRGERVDEHRFESIFLGPREIHIFNWQGESVTRIKIRKGTTCFVPSRDDKYIYSTDDNSVNKIFRYNLNPSIIH